MQKKRSSYDMTAVMRMIANGGAAMWANAHHRFSCKTIFKGRHSYRADMGCTDGAL
jgi:hypothetical protein